MNLHNGNITVREAMCDPRARVLLQREFPGIADSPMFRMAQGMTLNQVLCHVSPHVPKAKLDRVLCQLQNL